MQILHVLDALDQCFSNRVSRHICVFQVFISVSQNYFEKSFWGRSMQICHSNIKIIIFCLENVSPKNIYFLNVLPTKKKVENLCPIQRIEQCYVEERIRLCLGFRLKFGKRSKFLIVWSLLKQVISLRSINSSIT
jgi:hypothetical protein